MSKVEQALKSAIEAMEKESEIRELKFYEVESLYQCKAALAELEKCEPVAEVVLGKFADFISKNPVLKWHKENHDVGTLLYTVSQPKEWVGLSDEDVLKILEECAVSPYTNKQSAFGYAKAIEAKLKELNT